MQNSRIVNPKNQFLATSHKINMECKNISGS